MDFGLINFNTALIQKQAVDEVVKCNDFTADYGLYLTKPQAIELVKTRTHSLKENGRIEFGGGAIEKIIAEFCDSPYLTKYNYTEILHELIRIFYYYKNDSLDMITDETLIKFMNQQFNGTCQGSLELLAGRELAKMALNLRFGYPYDYQGEIDVNNEWEEGDDDDES